MVENMAAVVLRRLRSGVRSVQEIENVVTAWTAAFLRLVLLLPQHPAVNKDVPQMCVCPATSHLPHVKRSAAQSHNVVGKAIVRRQL